MTPTNYLDKISYYTTLALISELKSDDLQATMDTGAPGCFAILLLEAASIFPSRVART